jgi:hypothetical protein
LIDLMGETMTAQELGMREGLAFEIYQDGTQSGSCFAGAESLISRTPAAGTIGGIPASNAYWQNNVALNLTGGNIVTEIQKLLRLSGRYTGGQKPHFWVAGGDFFEAYRAAAGVTVNRRQEVSPQTGHTLDPITSGVFIDSAPVYWDPTLDAMDARFGTTFRSKMAYGINKDAICLVSPKSQFMRNRRPERVPNRYATYYPMTSMQALIVTQRNAHVVATIA